MGDLIDRQAAIERLREFANDDLTSTENSGTMMTESSVHLR